MQIKTTIIFLFSPTKMAIIKKQKKKQKQKINTGEDEQKLESLCTADGNEMVQPL